MPKTQSALLEAMAEQQVTVDGVTHPLPDPFLLLATENPIEQEGTFPLPEAQLDRFFLRTALGYPDADEELAILEGQHGGHPLESLRPVGAQGRRRRRSAAAVEDVYVDPLILRWIVDLVRATREAASTSRSAPRCAARSRSSGPRAPGRSCTAATTWCPEDVERLFVPVLGAPPGPRAGVPRRDARRRARRSLERLGGCLELAPRPRAGLDEAQRGRRSAP